MSVEFNTTCMVLSNEIPVVLHYNGDDPACVFMTFYNTEIDTSPMWTLSRDLISEALTKGTAGECDIVIRATPQKVKFFFSSPEGKARAVFRREVMEEFMTFVYDEVPEGEDTYEIPDEIPEDWLV